MKKPFALAFLAIVSFAGVRAARADRSTELNTAHLLPSKAEFAKANSQAAATSPLINHGGPVIHTAHVVSIFWGPTWATGGADSSNASHIVSFFNQFGTTAEYNTITQYFDSGGNIHTTNLGNTSWNDTTKPPTNVTDTVVRGEVTKYLQTHAFDSSAIYEVFLAPTSYASIGTSTSCGGPNLAFCAYHSHFSSGANSNIKYASMPYPNCGGCQASGFSTAQNFDHFSCHETREAVTDEDGNAWFDRSGNEADDKCAWSPAPFLSGGFGYQDEWSNAANGCVRTR